MTEKLPARSIIIAPRLPEKPKIYKGNPFLAEADIIADCDGTINGKPCGWHAMGERAAVKMAFDEHYKMYHSDEVGVILLNQPRQ